ncbi:MAG: tRNA (adenosine(37)-N6)-threonylcarbamoyltransferase complex dimerization subunit type 1 TsaB [Steroidobacteraceae bacterium]
MKLLAIDTASGCCSAALWIDGAVREAAQCTARDHARLVLPMVQGLLQEAGIGLPQLSAIAFGRGPGSFTGLRIAAGVVQGLAFGAGLGVVPVSDLRALAAQALRRADPAPAASRVLACMDARMSEVYAAVYAVEGGMPGNELLTERVTTAGQLTDDCRVAGGAVMRAAGRGLAAWPQIAVKLAVPAAGCFADAEPQARDIADIAVRELARGLQPAPPEAAQPVYLRDRVAAVPSGTVL